MRICAILTVRNEAAFLLEWLAHHRAAGITDFVVFSNDCEDGTDAMLERLAAMGWLDHQPNPGPYHKNGIQFTALRTAARRPAVTEADWLLPLDVDEFVNVHTGDHTVPALISALPEATAITLTWRLFGNGGKVRYEDAPITRQFTRAAPAVMHWPWRAAMFKTLYRNDGTYRMPGVHRPRQAREDRLGGARWFDGSGRALDDQFATRRIFSNFAQDNYALAQLNHYPLGAMESFVLKAWRGRAVHSDHMLGLDYWVERNFSTEQDRSIEALDAPFRAALAELRADATLARLHDAAVAWRRMQFEKLLEQEPYRALFGRLLMCPPSRPVPREAAQFMVHHAQRGKARQGE